MITGCRCVQLFTLLQVPCASACFMSVGLNPLWNILAYFKRKGYDGESSHCTSAVFSDVLLVHNAVLIITMNDELIHQLLSKMC